MSGTKATPTDFIAEKLDKLLGAIVKIKTGVKLVSPQEPLEKAIINGSKKYFIHTRGFVMHFGCDDLIGITDAHGENGCHFIIETSKAGFSNPDVIQLCTVNECADRATSDYTGKGMYLCRYHLKKLTEGQSAAGINEAGSFTEEMFNKLKNSPQMKDLSIEIPTNTRVIELSAVHTIEPGNWNNIVHNPLHQVTLLVTVIENGLEQWRRTFFCKFNQSQLDADNENVLRRQLIEQMNTYGMHIDIHAESRQINQGGWENILVISQGYEILNWLNQEHEQKFMIEQILKRAR